MISQWISTIDAAAQVEDTLEMPGEPITRARVKKFMETFFSLIKTNFLEGFEEGFVEGEMREEIGHTTYTCMTIVVVLKFILLSSFRTCVFI